MMLCIWKAIVAKKRKLKNSRKSLTRKTAYASCFSVRVSKGLFFLRLLIFVCFQQFLLYIGRNLGILGKFHAVCGASARDGA